MEWTTTRVAELRDFGDRWVAAWNAHDLDALTAMVTKDVRWDDPAMRGKPAEGRAELRAFAESFFRAFPDARVEAVGEPFLSLDGTGFAVRSRMTGTFTGELVMWEKPFGPNPPKLLPTERRFDVRGVDVYVLRDGLVADWAIYYDLLGFSSQLGLV